MSLTNIVRMLKYLKRDRACEGVTSESAPPGFKGNQEHMYYELGKDKKATFSAWSISYHNGDYYNVQIVEDVTIPDDVLSSMEKALYRSCKDRALQEMLKRAEKAREQRVRNLLKRHQVLEPDA